MTKEELLNEWLQTIMAQHQPSEWGLPPDCAVCTIHHSKQQQSLDLRKIGRRCDVLPGAAAVPCLFLDSNPEDGVISSNVHRHAANPNEPFVLPADLFELELPSPSPPPAYYEPHLEVCGLDSLMYGSLSDLHNHNNNCITSNNNCISGDGLGQQQQISSVFANHGFPDNLELQTRRFEAVRSSSPAAVFGQASFAQPSSHFEQPPSTTQQQYLATPTAAAAAPSSLYEQSACRPAPPPVDHPQTSFPPDSSGLTMMFAPSQPPSPASPRPDLEEGEISNDEEAAKRPRPLHVFISDEARRRPARESSSFSRRSWSPCSLSDSDFESSDEERVPRQVPRPAPLALAVDTSGLLQLNYVRRCAPSSASDPLSVDVPPPTVDQIKESAPPANQTIAPGRPDEDTIANFSKEIGLSVQDLLAEFETFAEGGGPVTEQNTSLAPEALNESIPVHAPESISVQDQESISVQVCPAVVPDLFQLEGAPEVVHETQVGPADVQEEEPRPLQDQREKADLEPPPKAGSVPPPSFSLLQVLQDDLPPVDSLLQNAQVSAQEIANFMNVKAVPKITIEVVEADEDEVVPAGPNDALALKIIEDITSHMIREFGDSLGAADRDFKPTYKSRKMKESKKSKAMSNINPSKENKSENRGSGEATKRQVISHATNLAKCSSLSSTSSRANKREKKEKSRDKSKSLSKTTSSKLEVDNFFNFYHPDDFDPLEFFQDNSILHNEKFLKRSGENLKSPNERMNEKGGAEPTENSDTPRTAAARKCYDSLAKSRSSAAKATIRSSRPSMIKPPARPSDRQIIPPSALGLQADVEIAAPRVLKDFDMFGKKRKPGPKSKTMTMFDSPEETALTQVIAITPQNFRQKYKEVKQVFSRSNDLQLNLVKRNDGSSPEKRKTESFVVCSKTDHGNSAKKKRRAIRVTSDAAEELPTQEMALSKLAANGILVQSAQVPVHNMAQVESPVVTNGKVKVTLTKQQLLAAHKVDRACSVRLDMIDIQSIDTQQPEVEVAEKVEAPAPSPRARAKRKLPPPNVKVPEVAVPSPTKTKKPRQSRSRTAKPQPQKVVLTPATPALQPVVHEESNASSLVSTDSSEIPITWSSEEEPFLGFVGKEIQMPSAAPPAPEPNQRRKRSKTNKKDSPKEVKSKTKLPPKAVKKRKSRSRELEQLQSLLYSEGSESTSNTGRPMRNCRKASVPNYVIQLQPELEEKSETSDIPLTAEVVSAAPEEPESELVFEKRDEEPKQGFPDMASFGVLEEWAEIGIDTERMPAEAEQESTTDSFSKKAEQSPMECQRSPIEDLEMLDQVIEEAAKSNQASPVSEKGNNSPLGEFEGQTDGESSTYDPLEDLVQAEPQPNPHKSRARKKLEPVPVGDLVPGPLENRTQQQQEFLAKFEQAEPPQEELVPNEVQSQFLDEFVQAEARPHPVEDLVHVEPQPESVQSSALLEPRLDSLQDLVQPKAPQPEEILGQTDFFEGFVQTESQPVLIPGEPILDSIRTGALVEDNNASFIEEERAPVSDDKLLPAASLKSELADSCGLESQVETAAEGERTDFIETLNQDLDTEAEIKQFISEKMLNSEPSAFIYNKSSRRIMVLRGLEVNENTVVLVEDDMEEMYDTAGLVGFLAPFSRNSPKETPYLDFFAMYPEGSMPQHILPCPVHLENSNPPVDVMIKEKELDLEPSQTAINLPSNLLSVEEVTDLETDEVEDKNSRDCSLSENEISPPPTRAQEMSSPDFKPRPAGLEGAEEPSLFSTPQLKSKAEEQQILMDSCQMLQPPLRKISSVYFGHESNLHRLVSPSPQVPLNIFESRNASEDDTDGANHLDSDLAESLGSQEDAEEMSSTLKDIPGEPPEEIADLQHQPDEPMEILKETPVLDKSVAEPLVLASSPTPPASSPSPPAVTQSEAAPEEAAVEPVEATPDAPVENSAVVPASLAPPPALNSENSNSASAPVAQNPEESRGRRSHTSSISELSDSPEEIIVEDIECVGMIFKPGGSREEVTSTPKPPSRKDRGDLGEEDEDEDNNGSSSDEDSDAEVSRPGKKKKKKEDNMNEILRKYLKVVERNLAKSKEKNKALKEQLFALKKKVASKEDTIERYKKTVDAIVEKAIGNSELAPAINIRAQPAAEAVVEQSKARVAAKLQERRHSRKQH